MLLLSIYCALSSCNVSKKSFKWITRYRFASFWTELGPNFLFLQKPFFLVYLNNVTSVYQLCLIMLSCYNIFITQCYNASWKKRLHKFKPIQVQTTCWPSKRNKKKLFVYFFRFLRHKYSFNIKTYNICHVK